MPLIIERNNLATMEVDAVVLPANPWLEEGPGTSRALYSAAGSDVLAEACQKFGYVDYGKAVMTDGFGLPARYIIHAIVPFWEEGNEDVPKQLYSCYKESLELAAASGLTSIAFPLLSSGRFRCPKQIALRIANNAITDFLCTEKPDVDSRDIMKSFATEPADMMIHLVVFDKDSVDTVVNLYGDIREYIDDHYVQEVMPAEEMPDVEEACEEESSVTVEPAMPMANYNIMPSPASACGKEPSKPKFSIRRPSFKSVAEAPLVFEEEAAESVADAITDVELDELITRQTETFTDALIRFVNASGKTNPQIYNKANISKQQFSRIISSSGYTPKKATIFALAVGLELNIKDTEYLLMKAGYAFSDSSKRDIIIRYFIERSIFDVFKINLTLFDFDQELIGSVML